MPLLKRILCAVALALIILALVHLLKGCTPSIGERWEGG